MTIVGLHKMYDVRCDDWIYCTSSIFLWKRGNRYFVFIVNSFFHINVHIFGVMKRRAKSKFEIDRGLLCTSVRDDILFE